MIGRFLMAALLSAALTVSPPTDTGAPEVSGAGGGDDQQQSQVVTDNADDGGLIVLPGDDVFSSSDDSLPGDGSGDDGEVMDDEFVQTRLSSTHLDQATPEGNKG